MSSLGPGSKLTDTLTLVRVLGEGGMGTVWLAEHRALGVEVAVKLMHPDLVRRDPTLVERFAGEARAAAKVRHPHIVQVLDHGTTADGVAWLSMELLEGKSLRDWLPSAEPVGSLGRAAFAKTLVEQVSGALTKAHAAGIVHRDLKPENLFVSEVNKKPFVKVLDFGIAKVATQPSGMTATGAVFGTAAYMSPEQLLSSKKVDARADVWALAVVAYELVVGRLPFEGETSSAIAVAVAMSQWVPPSHLVPSLGPGVDALFAQAFAKEPASRHASADEFARAFDEALARAARGAQRTELPSVPVGASAPLAVPKTEVHRGPIPGLAEAARGSAPGAGKADAEPRASAKQGRGLVLGGVGLAVVVAAALLATKGSSPGAASKTAPEAPSAAAQLASTGAASATAASSAASPSGACPNGMALVPAGRFTMGFDGGEDDEKPTHDVKVARFCMDRTEVTVAAYAACVDRKACSAAGTRIVPDPSWGLSAADVDFYSGLCQAGQSGREQHPVNCVDWAQAKAYCQAQGRRLPTEEEWEYAARGGDESRKQPWGSAPADATRLNACGAECVAFGTRHGQRFESMYAANDGHETTAPVGSFPAGAGRWGHLDLAGNVWEWTDSGYAESYGEARGTDKRVKRGLSWSYGKAADARASYRSADIPLVRSAAVGFRCAADALP